MIKCLELKNEYISHIKRVRKYLLELSKNESMYYRKNQEIIYIGLINRTYSLWETFCKELAYEYYSNVKDHLLQEGGLPEKLKLNELPGYIIEAGIIDENYIKYELKKELITYTSRNMGYQELNNLYRRFGIDIASLSNSIVLNSYINAPDTICFDIPGNSGNKLKDAMSALVNERNTVSHFADIDEYKNLEIIVQWTYFYEKLISELAKLVCVNILNREYKNEIHRIAGTFVNHYKRDDVLCMDIADNTYIDNKTLIVISRNHEISFILKPVSFMVEDNKVEEVHSGDKAGIKYTSLFEDNPVISTNSAISVINGLFN